MLPIHPQRINGNWEIGFALDLHTTSSTPIGENEAGHMQFETVRPPIAQHLYELKYSHNQTAALEIISTASGFVQSLNWKIDCVVSTPPSSQRIRQPVQIIASGIASQISKPYFNCLTTTREPSQLKNIVNPKERATLVNGLYSCDPTRIRGLDVLLVDDLFRSGSTLNKATKVLRDEGRAKSVKVLTITRTRSNR